MRMKAEADNGNGFQLIEGAMHIGRRERAHLGAHDDAVGGVLQIGPPIDVALLVTRGGAHGETGIWSIGMPISGIPRLKNERLELLVAFEIIDGQFLHRPTSLRNDGYLHNEENKKIISKAIKPKTERTDRFQPAHRRRVRASAKRASSSISAALL